MAEEKGTKKKEASCVDNVIKYVVNHSFGIGISIRLALMFLLPLLLDDGVLLKGVKYTDIDYLVFNDAASHVVRGGSPYDRHTYRYSPFLAAILALPGLIFRDGVNDKSSGSLLWTLCMWWSRKKYFGRLLFCVADAICGKIIFNLRRQSRKQSSHISEKEVKEKKIKSSIFKKILSPDLQDCLWWLFNPLPINICTRGSAESFVVLLPVLMTVFIAQSVPSKSNNGMDEYDESKSRGSSFFFPFLQPMSRQTSRGSIIFRAGLAGSIHGLAIHAKLYPLIYTVSFMAAFSFQEQSILSSRKNNKPLLFGCWKNILPPKVPINNIALTEQTSFRALNHYPFPWLDINRLFCLIQIWVDRLFFTPSSITFLLYSFFTFSALTASAYFIFGPESLEEGLIYHFSRVDHRHNYSMFWYWIYLDRGRISAASPALDAITTKNPLMSLGKLLMFPQAVLLAYISLGVAPYDLSFALFLQTFVFVAQNKVMTAQYFTWYLCLLPLCSDRIQWTTRRMIVSLLLLGLSIVLWLLSAFCLEMLGLPVHIYVWSASVLFYVANINLLVTILGSYQATWRHKLLSDIVTTKNEPAKLKSS